MQKVYQRINWENEPSKKTAVSEDNLNKMDYALDKIDDRVVNLSGYETRVAESEKNAKQSEINAKESEINAKESELKAKEYMEQAFSGTPEGYSALVEQVGLLDIATSTGNTLYNSKKGGYRLNDLVGNTEQNGEPSQSTPIAIENTFDCVEMMQGYWSGNGYANSTEYVCNKIPIPCVAGNNVKIKYDKISTLGFAFYDANMNCITSMLYAENVKEYLATAPTNTKYVCYNVKVSSGVTPQTVGKITLTVNGKHVGKIVEHGKNILGGIAFANALANSGATSTINTANKTVSLKGDIKTTLFIFEDFKENTQYTIFYKGYNNDGGIDSNIRLVYTDNTYQELTFNTSDVNRIVTDENKSVSRIKGVWRSATGILYYEDFGIFEGVLTLDDFEPYTEKVATFFLNEPLRATDRLVRKDGVINENHNVGEYVFTGEENINKTTNAGIYMKFNDMASGRTLFCTHGFKFTKTDMLYLSDIQQYLGTLTTEEFKAWLTEQYNNGTPLKMVYPLETPTLTPLDTASQLALNDMETFNGTTYIEVDSKVKSTRISGKYGTSQVGAYTLKCMNDNDTDRVERAELKAQLNELAVAFVSQ